MIDAGRERTKVAQCPVHGETSCECTLVYRISSLIRQLPSFGLLPGHDKMISANEVLQIISKQVTR